MPPEAPTSQQGPLATHDAVRHPNHYISSPAKCRGCSQTIECIDVVQHMPFNLGNVVKYVWRLGLKKGAHDTQDLFKARQYIDFEIERLKGGVK